MSGLKNFERIEKKRYPYKMRQVLLDDEQEFLFEYEEIRPKKTPKPKRSYDEVFTTAIKEYAKTFISQIETFTTQRRKAPSFSYGDTRRNALGVNSVSVLVLYSKIMLTLSISILY
ncbi:hypothetical protein KVD51_07410 [Helicobacter pylori]|nr:hypothetical protein KVD51_07410 [Helicobacter pylori]